MRHNEPVRANGLSRAARAVFRRRGTPGSTQRPVAGEAPVEDAHPGGVDNGHSGDGAVPGIDGTGTTATGLVARGTAELMRARAEGARITAEANERLVEAIKREQAVAAAESNRREDAAALHTVAAAQKEAAEIVSNARAEAIRLLEEAQELLGASRRTEAPN